MNEYKNYYFKRLEKCNINDLKYERSQPKINLSIESHINL